MSTQGIAAGGCYRPDANRGAPTAPKGEGSYAMPGGANVTLQDGKLSVTGGKGADQIDVQKLANGNYGVSVNGQTLSFDGSKVQELDIKGGKGADGIHVGAGVDVKTTIDGGKGDDTIVNHAKDAFIKGGKGNDQIFNTGRGARIDGGKGSDSIFNSGAFAQVNGGKGHDSIFNSGAFAQLTGGRGNDQIMNTGFAARVRGGLGHDRITNSGAFSSLEGGRGHDQIFNTGRHSHLDGGRGLDSLFDLSRLRGVGRDAFFGGGFAHQRLDLSSFFQQRLFFGF